MHCKGIGQTNWIYDYHLFFKKKISNTHNALRSVPPSMKFFLLSYLAEKYCPVLAAELYGFIDLPLAFPPVLLRPASSNPPTTQDPLLYSLSLSLLPAN
jgi:hypothetical protein